MQRRKSKASRSCGSQLQSTSSQHSQRGTVPVPQCQGRTHVLLIKALPSHEHLHILTEGEGPVILAEAVEQLGILVVRVLVTDWKNTGQGCQSTRDTRGSHSAGCCLLAKSCEGFMPCPSLCPLSHGTISIQDLVPKNHLLMNT